MFVRSTVVAAGLVAVLASPAIAAGGPYAGTVSQGQTKVHSFNNEPKTGECITLATTYRVSLSYAPASDVLTLAAGGKTSVGSAGGASVTFERGVCTSFAITVTGTSVADTAAYTVVVTSGLLAAGGGGSVTLG